ncbi:MULTISPECIES: flagellar hook-associated protein FlgL [unclassified Halomonas]|uniref:flagellar hook-associated protein FlgL n=1 Tax=unclassified Halomonas TaxID=2609666 RepID=UPI0020766EC1|nr:MULTISPECIES: flagellar hook-associated protein FlgL [unclassified Halomonas]
MRISSVTMYEQSSASINRQQGDLLKIGQQLSSGRKVVNPSDNPQAASQAVGVSQSMAMSEQYGNSRVSARTSLAQSESVLNSVSDSITSAKTLLIQASSDTLSNADRESIASELKGVYQTLIGQANTADGNGRYLFGGQIDNAPPYVANEQGAMKYNGSDMVREQRIDSSRNMPVAESGRAIFQKVPSGAGYIGEAVRSDGVRNAGSVILSGPQVSDVNGEGYGDDYRITFGGDTETPTLSVQRLTQDQGWQPVPDMTDIAYTGGDAPQRLVFGGLSVSLSGASEAADEVNISQAKNAQREPDLFKAMEEAIRVLENPASSDVEKADLRNTLNTSMRDLDNALDNVLTVRASAGARLNELDVIDSIASNRMMSYTQTMSDLVDLDYVEAISEYSLRQVGMQASQQTFMNMKGMSLFDYM